MTTLEIDTTDNKATNLVLRKGEKEFRSMQKYDAPKADAVLTEIEKLLQKNSTKPSDLEKIIVHRGPGSYTGIRVGLTIANTLAFALKIPVNDKNMGEYETALYQ